MRPFDPVRLGSYESAAWEAYYRRRWLRLLPMAVGLVRVGFGMSWPRTIRGAWLVLRAIRAWAPFPDHDLERARHLMGRFYRLVRDGSRTRFDVAEAARLEVEGWRVLRGVV